MTAASERVVALTRLTLVEACEAVHKGEVTSAALTEAALGAFAAGDATPRRPWVGGCARLYRHSHPRAPRNFSEPGRRELHPPGSYHADGRPGRQFRASDRAISS